MGILQKIFGKSMRRRKDAVDDHIHSVVKQMLTESYIAASRGDHSKQTEDEIVGRAQSRLVSGKPYKDKNP